jgi:hyperosmotically inducible protein
MRLAKIIPLALIGASLSACEPGVPATAQAEPHTLAPTGAATHAKPAAVAASAASPQGSVRQPAPEVVSDAFITGAVRAAMMGDPGLQGSDVSVNTSHGVVSLTGRVKSREQAAIAAAHAEGEDGVMRVDNTLVVLND